MAFRACRFRHQKRKKTHIAHNKTTTGIILKPIFVPEVMRCTNGRVEASDATKDDIVAGAVEEAVGMADAETGEPVAC